MKPSCADYNQKQFQHKHEQDKHIRLAEEKIPRLGQIRREIAALGLKKARLVLGAGDGEDFDLESAIGALGKREKGPSPGKTDFPPIIWSFTTIAPSVKIPAM